MTDQTTQAVRVEIYPDDPEATARNVWAALLPVLYQATQHFDTKKRRAEFLSYIGFQFGGSVAAELGSTDAADMLEMIARVGRTIPMPAKGRTH